MRYRRTTGFSIALAGVLAGIWTVQGVVTAPNRLLRVLAPMPGTALWSPDGRYVVSSRLELPAAVFTLDVWNPGAGRRMRQLRKEFRPLSFTADSKRLLTMDLRGRLRIWNTDTWMPMPGVRTSRPFTNGFMAMLSPDGSCLAATDSRQLSITLRSTVTGKLLSRSEPATDVCGFSRDSRLVACGVQDQGIYLADVRTGRRVHFFSANNLAFAPDSNVVACDDRDGAITLYRSGTWAVIRRLPGATTSVSSLAFSADGRMLAVASRLPENGSPAVKVFDTETGMLLMRLPGSEPVWGATFASDGAMLAVKVPNSVQLWAVPPREQLLLKARILSVAGR
jgi:WD40 repeat protein